jgi:hypothetical protein
MIVPSEIPERIFSRFYVCARGAARHGDNAAAPDRFTAVRSCRANHNDRHGGARGGHDIV